MFVSKFSPLKLLGAVVAFAAASMAHAQLTLAQQAPAGAAQAMAPAVPAVPITFRQSASADAIANINERMSVKQAQLAELELEAKLAAKQDELRRFKSGPTTPILDDEFTPTVLEIGGVDGRLIANLVVQGGNVQAVRVGDSVGGWVVREIKVDALTLTRGKEAKRLAFGSATTPVAAQAPVPAVPIGMVSPALPRMP